MFLPAVFLFLSVSLPVRCGGCLLPCLDLKVKVPDLTRLGRLARVTVVVSLHYPLHCTVLSTHTNKLGLGDPPAGHPGLLTAVTLRYIWEADWPESSRNQLERR